MARRLLGPVMCPRRHRTIHKAQRMRTHAQWAPGCHRSQRGKTVQRWSEEQVRPCRRQQLSGRPGILT
ncbi:unnamed protein product, partial [Staurois parvus]